LLRGLARLQERGSLREMVVERTEGQEATRNLALKILEKTDK
jgi:hypothetical protein